MPCTHDLAGDEHDGEGDDRLDGRLRNVHEAQRRGGQRQAVRHRERGDRPHETPPTLDENQQGEHEQQVVDPEQEVFDSQTQVGTRHLHL